MRNKTNYIYLSKKAKFLIYFRIRQKQTHLFCVFKAAIGALSSDPIAQGRFTPAAVSLHNFNPESLLSAQWFQHKPLINVRIDLQREVHNGLNLTGSVVRVFGRGYISLKTSTAQMALKSGVQNQLQ
ncbi:MAG: hypothetical protein HY965_01415 [Ignavibacteriales bacterium]|nr:hypothetical protein [Ignavibacteriales bacterium]